jgi:hypothetical protein
MGWIDNDADDVVEMIQAWRPVALGSEAEYEDALYTHLSKRLKKGHVARRQFWAANSRADTLIGGQHLTRKESEERQQAVLRFFVENPRATGEEAQRALSSGLLTGKQGQPPMGLGMLFRLKRQAEAMAAKDDTPPERPARMNGGAQLSEEQTQALRESARGLQRLLSEMPDTVLGVNVTREGVRVVRTTEEEL